MKRILTFLALCMVMCLHSCYDDAALWETVNDHSARLTQLETLCNQMNSDISSLKTLVTTIQNGGYITSVTPLVENRAEVGYMLTLSNGKTVSVYHGAQGEKGDQGDKGDKGDKGDQGDKGSTPNIAVKQDTDGKYYWTVDGEWLLDDTGNRVQVAPEEAVDGITPLVRIENGIWQVSYDNASSWNDLGSAEPENPCIFKDVKYENGILTLYFSDETMLPLSVGSAFQIVLGEYDLSKGTEFEIPYTIQGATGEVTLFAVGDKDGYIRIDEIVEESAYSGRIKFHVYWESREISMKLAIFAVNEAGTTVSKIVRVTSAVAEDLDVDEYILDPEAKQLEIKMTTNRTWEVQTGVDWIAYVNTKAVVEKTYVLDIQENTGDYRSAVITFTSGDMEIPVKIRQKSSRTSENLFQVNLTRNDLSSTYNTIYLDKRPDKICNSEGKTVAEVLGYSSWEELAQAIGNIENIANNLDGDVIITMYDVLTGEPFDKVSSPLYYMLDKDGHITENYYDEFASISFSISGDLVSYDFSIYLNHPNLTVGQTFSCGVMLSSATTDVRIEINIKKEQYLDPEAGKYTDPLPPGTYEFDIKDEIEIDVPYITGTSKTSYVNESVAEKIKQTIGMSTYELWKNYDSFYYNLEYDGSVYNNLRFDSDGNKITSSDYAIRIYQYGWDANYKNEILRYSFPRQFDDNIGYYWKQPMLDAIEKGTVFKYKYLFEYRGKDQIGSYSFVFNIEVKYKKKESTL